MNQVEVRSLSVEYQMRRTGERVLAIRDLSFTTQAGKFTCILGTSGCGKTTLLNVIAGLKKATTGQVLLNGIPVTGPGRDRAMVFQNPALLPWRNVWRNITYGLEIQGYSIKEAREKAIEMISLVGLQGFEESFPRELSGGMQQRVNLARALVTNPGLLLMDEPFASLDAQMREFMQTEIERIWLQTGQTTIFVTHMIDEAIFLADEIIVMSNRPGRVKAIIPVTSSRPRLHSLATDTNLSGVKAAVHELIQAEFKELQNQSYRVKE